MAISNKSFVKFENVQKSYDGEVLVVKDLNLEISKGEFLTMLGPSGSGKTTCLMMLAGFETATHGIISLDGNPIGIVGSRALMLVPTISGMRVKISGQRCNITIRDANCWFSVPFRFSSLLCRFGRVSYYKVTPPCWHPYI